MLFKKRSKDISIEGLNIPNHIAIIPDGNGRWAKKRMSPRKVGHREGAIALKETAKYCNSIGVKYMTVYAFSTENWKRDEDEVNALMDLFAELLLDKDNELTSNNIRIKVIGRRDRLSPSLVEGVEDVEKRSSVNTGMLLILCIDYGSRDEITHAVRSIAQQVEDDKILPDNIDEKVFADNLMTKDIPDPDLLIRTSGEYRISNYLLWQLAYTEFWFTDVLWPDFSSSDINRAIYDFNNRDRRFGGAK